MHFKWVDEYYAISPEGYHISKSKSGNVVKFSAWKPKEKPWQQAELLAIAISFRSAVLYCEKHYNMTTALQGIRKLLDKDNNATQKQVDEIYSNETTERES